MITPRWEFRSFGQRFGGAESRLAALPPQGVQESDELYLLSAAGANVKVRDALMDIKALQEVNADGLEQWTAGHEGGLSAARGRGGEGVRRPAAADRHRGPAPATPSTGSSRSSPRRAARSAR